MRRHKATKRETLNDLLSNPSPFRRVPCFGTKRTEWHYMARKTYQEWDRLVGNLSPDNMCGRVHRSASRRFVQLVVTSSKLLVLAEGKITALGLYCPPVDV
jgi:hypothetical protein